MLENISEHHNFYTGCIDGQLITYCEQVKTGCKPIAFMNLQSRYVDIVVTHVKKNNLKIYIENVPNTDNLWYTVYIYKHHYLIEVIKNLPNNPKTIYDHWVIGKACGYSDDAIGEFINTIKYI